MGHGGHHAAHGAGGTEVGVAGCGEPADGGQGSAGAIAGRHQQGLRRMCVVVRRMYPPPGAKAGQPSFHARQAVGGGDGPQQGQRAGRAPTLARGIAPAAPGPLPTPRAPLPGADIGHQAGLPNSRMHHALWCLAAADGGMSLFVSVSSQRVRDALQKHRQHAP